MNEYASKLVAALRSGEYKQNGGYLRTGDKYCCLGVACDLVREEAGAEWRAQNNGRYSFSGRMKGLPEKVRTLYDFRTSLGTFRKRNDIDSLAILNDSGKTFAEIADIIESEPEGLFG